jgi:prevent-host-death family protein
MAENADQVTTAEFVTKCLGLIDEVAKRRTALVITKDGKPLVKLVPISEEPIDIFGRMAGKIEIVGDIISPVDEDEWTGDADNI